MIKLPSFVEASQMQRDDSLKNPIITFVITSFNQKDYVGKAVQSALDQDYMPLEIIIADDHSTDGSYEDLQKLVGQYAEQGGKHQVLLHRNEINLGVLRNCENAFLLAHGELIVLGGGDDISHSNRVSTIVRNWLTCNKKPTVIFHDVNLIGLKGEALEHYFGRPTIRNPLGAAMAFSPIVVKRFLNSVETRGYEDNVFARRAYAFGDSLYINEKLVDYRYGTGTTSTGALWDCRCRTTSATVYSAKQNLVDIEQVRAVINPSRYDAIKTMLLDVIAEYEPEYEMIAGKNVLIRYKGFVGYMRHLNHRKLGFCSIMVFYLPCLVPILRKPITAALRVRNALTKWKVK